MTELALSQDQGVNSRSNKSDVSTSKKHFVPIKPAFRPLLPKPNTCEPSTPNAIHIHTRASLNAGRKRFVSSKAEIQKRRRATTHLKSMHFDAKLEHTSNNSTISTNHSTVAKTIVNPKIGSSDDHDNLHISKPVNTSCTAATYNMLGLVDSREPYLCRTEDSTRPNTPLSVIGSPQSVNTASIFGTDRFSSPATSENLASIDAVVNDFKANDDSLYLCNMDQIDGRSFTPPDTQYTSYPVSFGTIGDFDDFSDLYFRSQSVCSDDETQNQQVAGFPEATQIEEDQSNPYSSNCGSREEGFSFLEYFAPLNDPF